MKYFVAWLLGWPLVNSISYFVEAYMRYLNGMGEYSPETFVIVGFINLIIWIAVGRAIWKSQHLDP